jgi:V8-like Glu-specific endopeptidase
MSDTTDAKKTAEEIAAYWTRERRDKAKERPLKPAGERPVEVLTPEGAPQGAPETHPGHDPDGQALKASDVAFTVTPATRVPNPTQYPWRTVGKLYFSSGGDDYTGSASVIYRNTILTAAHNLYVGGVWSKDILFVPAYTYPNDPYGSWTWSSASVMPEWIPGENESNDVGTVELRVGGAAGRSIGDVVGYLGYTINRSLPREWDDVGYPRNYDEKRYMYQQPGLYTRSLDGGNTVGKVGDTEGGASGGPWLMPPGDLNFVNGLHSFRQGGDVFSPYFRTTVGNFIQAHLK